MILILTDNVTIANYTPQRAIALLDFVYGYSPDFVGYRSPYANLLLVCAHARKDKCCGTIELMLIKALKDATKMCQVKAQVVLVSHLGGNCNKLIYIIYILCGEHYQSITRR